MNFSFDPDLTVFQVAIGGGGFIPARILRTFIKIPILAVGIKLYDDTTNTAQVSSDPQADANCYGAVLTDFMIGARENSMARRQKCRISQGKACFDRR